MIVALAVKPALPVPYPLRPPTRESATARDDERAAAPCGDTSNRQLAGENRLVRASQFDVHFPRKKVIFECFSTSRKSSSLKMIVARRFACPESTSFDRRLDGNRVRIHWIEDKCAVDIFEMAADKSHHHVTHTKPCRPYARFEKLIWPQSAPSSKDFSLTPTALHATA